MSIITTVIVLAFGIVVTGNIKRLDIPVAIRNGSGPIEFACVYEVSDSEDYGLVVKWYHDNEQIYQWIPPMEPQDLGIIAGLTSYTPEITNRPQSHSIISVREVTMDMSGKYTCVVATFYTEDYSKSKKMIVYVPEETLTVQASDFNETHVNLNCTAVGARPRPDLIIITGAVVLKNLVLLVDDYDADDPRISLSGIITKPARPAVIECEIQIPGTGYGRREKLVYYPDAKNNGVPRSNL